MDEFLIFNVLCAFVDRFLGRPALISGGYGHPITVVRVGYRSFMTTAGGLTHVISALYKAHPRPLTDIDLLEILPGQFLYEGIAIPIEYESLSRSPKTSCFDGKKTVPRKENRLNRFN